MEEPKAGGSDRAMRKWSRRGKLEGVVYLVGFIFLVFYLCQMVYEEFLAFLCVDTHD